MNNVENSPYIENMKQLSRNLEGAFYTGGSIEAGEGEHIELKSWGVNIIIIFPQGFYSTD